MKFPEKKNDFVKKFDVGKTTFSEYSCKTKKERQNFVKKVKKV